MRRLLMYQVINNHNIDYGKRTTLCLTGKGNTYLYFIGFEKCISTS